MPTKRTQPREIPPDLPPEKAYSVLKAQLKRLQDLKGRNYQEANGAEDEWFHLTEKLVLRSFGSGSPNYGNILHARSAGDHTTRVSLHGPSVDHARSQANFEARQQAHEAVLRSCIAELEMDLPTAEIKGALTSREKNTSTIAT